MQHGSGRNPGAGDSDEQLRCTGSADSRIDETAPVISRGHIFVIAPIETLRNLQTQASGWIRWRPTMTAAPHDGVLEVGSACQWEEGGRQIVSTVQERVPMRRIVGTGPAQAIVAIHMWEFTSTADGVGVHTEQSCVADVATSNAAMLKPLLDNARRVLDAAEARWRSACC